MLKKILVSVLVGGLSVGLIAGAINRTASKSDQSTTTAALGGRNQRQVSPGSEAGTNSGGRGNGNGAGVGSVGESDDSIRNGNRGGNGNESGLSSTQPLNDGLASVEDVYSIDGTVLHVDDASLTLILPEGEQLTIDGRSWSYAVGSGFTTAANHVVSLTGFDEDGEFKVISMTDLDTLVTISLREESGRPLWAGRGGRNA
ncbi:MAG: hypothetical protein ACK2T2_05615 [Anaerolineales bacterium]